MSGLRVFSFAGSAGIAIALIFGLTLFDGASGAYRSIPSELQVRGAMFAAGLLPIVAFYTSLYFRLRQRSDIPSDSEIDSIYYLGFLVTLVTLIATVLSVTFAVFRDEGRPTPLGQQTTLISVSIAFALSLTATAISLFFRISLVAIKERVGGDQSLEAIETRVSEMILRADHAYSQLVASIESTLDQFRELSRSQRSAQQADLESAMQVFNQQLSAFVHKFAHDIAEAGLAESIQRVSASFQEGGGALAAAIKSLGPIPRRASVILERLDDVASATEGSHAEISQLQSNISAAATRLGSLPSDALREGILRLGSQLNALNNALGELQNQTLAAASASSGSLNRTTQELENASNDLGRAFAGLSDELAKSAGSLARAVRGHQDQ